MQTQMTSLGGAVDMARSKAEAESPALDSKTIQETKNALHAFAKELNATVATMAPTQEAHRIEIAATIGQEMGTHLLQRIQGTFKPTSAPAIALAATLTNMVLLTQARFNDRPSIDKDTQHRINTLWSREMTIATSLSVARECLQ
jgi:hypothetical protein